MMCTASPMSTTVLMCNFNSLVTLTSHLTTSMGYVLDLTLKRNMHCLTHAWGTDHIESKQVMTFEYLGILPAEEDDKEMMLQKSF